MKPILIISSTTKEKAEELNTRINEALSEVRVNIFNRAYDVNDANDLTVITGEVKFSNLTV